MESLAEEGLIQRGPVAIGSIRQEAPLVRAGCLLRYVFQMFPIKSIRVALSTTQTMESQLCTQQLNDSVSWIESGRSARAENI